MNPTAADTEKVMSRSHKPATPPVNGAGLAVGTSAPASGDNQWQFEDDATPVETWRDVVRSQAPDVALSQLAVGSALTPLMLLLSVRKVRRRARDESRQERP